MLFVAGDMEKEDQKTEESLSLLLPLVEDDEIERRPAEVSFVARDEFIEALKVCPNLAERFENLDCVNMRADDGGATSVVFKAIDSADERKVAVKVLDKSRVANESLESLIMWESLLLEKLKGKKNCQTLKVPCSKAYVDVGGRVIPTSYLATLYLKTDVRRFFYRRDGKADTDLSAKLTVFLSILNSIKTLHAAGICHRDIKPENFRARTKDGKTVVVAIDLGLALACEDLERELRCFSPKGMGTQEYAAPEKLCGFENDYELGKGADMYALGCLLFELVGKDMFYEQFKMLNRGCYARIMNDSKVYGTEGSLEQRLALYDSYIDRDFSQLYLPRIPENLGIPPYARKELQSLIEGLCCLDYRKRTRSDDIESVKTKIRSIIRELQNSPRGKRARERALRRGA